MSPWKQSPGMTREERERLPHDALAMLDHRADFGALQTARSPTAFDRFARAAGLAFILWIVAVLFLPWQQFVSGKGQVVALDPLERPLLIEAPLSGRIEVSNVLEGQRVSAGDVLFVMTDNDPNLRINLETERAAAESKLEASIGKLEEALEELREKEIALPEAIRAADQKILAAESKERTARLQFNRVERLFRSEIGGLESERSFELATLGIETAEAELTEARADRVKVEADGNAGLALSRGKVEEARGDSATAAKEVAAATSKVNEAATLEVVAPRDGVVQRLTASEGTFLSSGTALAMLVPETTERRVEMWMDGNDIPLVQPRQILEDGTVVEGSSVRLQFEGWPVVQFIGWPSVARGTFGGEVVLIDPTDDGTGRFRVLIAPRPDVLDDGETVPWPGPRFLRQGAKTNGWVLLNRVPLWFEIWRQLNGFPPTLTQPPAGTGVGMTGTGTASK